VNRIRRLLNTADIVARGRVERLIPFWPIEWIEGLQRYRLRSIVRHAYNTVPFYREAMDERGLRPKDFQIVEDLSRLPLIDSKTVRDNTEGFLSTCHTEDSWQASYSSGCTSGARRVIYWDNACVLRKLACHERDRVVFRNLVGQRASHRHMHISTTGSAYVEMRPLWEASTFISRNPHHHHDVSADEPFEFVAEHINAVRPHVVSSYGSYAEHFFRFLADRQLSIAAPRVWIHGADLLSPSGRDLIENTFGCPTYSTYGATETERLGFQCERRQGFHLNVDLCEVRLVDEEGEDVEPGESGEVVTSNLHNQATVLLNYRLGDNAVMASEPCSCGRTLPLLERLEGRVSEMLYLPDGRSISRLTLEELYYDELKPTLQFQVVCAACGQMRWRIVPFSGADRDALRRHLLEKCRAVIGKDIQAAVEFVENIPTSPNGKFIHVVSQPAGPYGPKSIMGQEG